MIVISFDSSVFLHFRFLASGNSYADMSFSWRYGVPTISNFIPEVCDAIWNVMGPIYMRVPRDHDDWRLLAENFAVDCDFPHCLFAADGKHIRIKCPCNSGSMYVYNHSEYYIQMINMISAILLHRVLNF